MKNLFEQSRGPSQNATGHSVTSAPGIGPALAVFLGSHKQSRALGLKMLKVKIAEDCHDQLDMILVAVEEDAPADSLSAFKEIIVAMPRRE